MIITIASGKGGTGKTTLAVNMAAALARSEMVHTPVRLLDCDVEEPDAHLFVRPCFTRTATVEVLKPVWHEDLCTGCGECGKACLYNAIAVVKGKVLMFPELCHACGVCSYVCPEDAITEKSASIGRVELDERRPEFTFGHGVLNIGEALAPAVVEEVKKHALPDGLTIIDAAPGTACPVVAAVNGADVAILVTEPTPFGLNDLRLALGLSLEMGVPSAIVVNRSDGTDALIQEYADEVGVPVIGRIPFRREYAETYSRGDLLVDRHPELRALLLDIYARVCEVAAGPAQPPPRAEAPMRATARTAAASAAVPGAHRDMTVISGKGGTGKTIVTASLAALLDGKVLADCDVDAADLHLLLKPHVQEVEDFVGGRKALILPDQCTGCGHCADLCHFDAIKPEGFDDEGKPTTYRIDDFACEGCGLCGYVCPVGAVEVSEAITGQCYISETECGPFAHAKLGIAEENTGRLVTHVRDRAAELTAVDGADRIVADGSPGTGCPVIASVAGVHLALIVTEPTVSGVHDLVRVLQLTQHFGVRALICINKCDLNPDQAERIRAIGRKMDAPVIGEIPFDEEVNQTLQDGQILVNAGTGAAARALRSLAEILKHEL